MNAPHQYFSPSEAAERLGVSVKALRLYEQRGLVQPLRSEVGWRAYGPQDMARIAEIVALRSLGLTLSQIKRLSGGDGKGLEETLGSQQAVLERRLEQLLASIDSVRGLRSEMAAGRIATIGDLMALAGGSGTPEVSFELPWPWGGEQFELLDIKPITYIIGSLGSGKTRLAKRLADAVPDGCFLALDRLEQSRSEVLASLENTPIFKARVEHALTWLKDDGAEVSDALIALLAGIVCANAATVVVDMVEEGLDHSTQEALSAYLRLSMLGKRLLLMTRSSAILDLQSVGHNEAIILCPANHSVPRLVLPYSGAEGYESVQNCLATPEVRARIAAVPPKADQPAAGRPAITM